MTMPTTSSDRLGEAEDAVELARARLLDTLQDLTEQLEPRRLVRELWEDAKVKGADLAEEAIDAVKSRPIAATGVAAAIAMFLAREPIAELAGKLIGGDKDAAARKATRTARKPTRSRKSPAAKPRNDTTETSDE